MFRSRYFINLLVLVWLGSGTSLMAIDPVIPQYRAKQVVVASAQEEGMDYLAFPSLLRIGPDELLISFKRGSRHGRDEEAVLDMLHFDTLGNRILERRQVAYDPGFVHQMGEWVQFGDGEIVLYIDTQQTGHDDRHYRAGMREVRFSSDLQDISETRRSPWVGEREYGYPFEFIVDGDTTYMLVMAFGYRPGGRWSVDVIKSDDNGGSWEFVRNLTDEFGGHKINESSFIPWDEGFLVTTREYGPNQRVYRTDRYFRMLQESNLSESHGFIEHHLGRPRLFTRDGKIYLIGRNWRTTDAHGRLMELVMLRLNPETLEVENWVILDNVDRANITDAHYGVPYFQERDGVTYLNVIDYRGLNRAHPDIVRHEFKWEEVR